MSRGNTSFFCHSLTAVFLHFLIGENLQNHIGVDTNEALGISPYQVTTGSGKKVYWRCNAKHHTYLRTISKEATRNSQCPVCKEENQKYLSDYPELLNEFAYDLNNISPAELTAGSDTAVKWRCEKYGHVWETAPYHRIKDKTRCPFCTNKKVLPGFNDLLTVNPPNLRYWDYDENDKDGIIATNYTPSSKQKAWWICDKGHHTYDSIFSVISRVITPCSECLREIKADAAEKKKQHDIAAAAIAERKQQRQAAAVAVAERKKQQQQAAAAAITERRQQRQATAAAIAERKQQRQAAAAERKEQQEASAAVTIEKRWVEVSQVTQFWDYDENQKRGFKLEDATLRRVYCWKCSNGHKWKSDLSSILRNPECPECFIEDNSIAKKYSYLANNYNIKMNRGIPPEKCLAVVADYYWWTCQKGHTFIATLTSAAKHKETGCMYCDRKKSFYSICN